MKQFLILFILLSIILFLSRNFSQKLFGFWYLLTGKKSWSIWLTALFLLPGTVIHELSHFLTASILGVKTGEIDLLPKYEKGLGGIKMGSVQIAKVGFIRRTLIGIAPIFAGSLVMFVILKLFGFEWGDWEEILESFLVLYLIFSISITMFSSKKDLEVAFPFFVILILIFLGLWLLEIKINEKLMDSLIIRVIKLNRIFLIVVLINLGFGIILRLINKVFEKVLGKKIVYK